jgi:hypothetical protein
MATAEQEKLYSEIMHFYNLAEQMIQVLEGSQESMDEENFTIAEDMINCLEDCTDKLGSSYIDYIKGNSDAKNAITPVREALNAISAKIEECRGKIVMINS